MSLPLDHLVGEARGPASLLSGPKMLRRLAEVVVEVVLGRLLVPRLQLFPSYPCGRLQPRCNSSSCFPFCSFRLDNSYTSSRSLGSLPNLQAGEAVVGAGGEAGVRRPSLNLVQARASSRQIFET